MGHTPDVSVTHAASALRRLVIYRDLLQDELLACLAELEQAAPDSPRWETVLARGTGLLLQEQSHTREQHDNPWQTRLLRLILESENPFSLAAEAGQDNTLPRPLQQAIDRDLELLQSLFHFNFMNLAGFEVAATAREGDVHPVASLLAKKVGPAALRKVLAQTYRRNGCGLFSRFHALRWSARGDGGGLEGILHPDPVRLADLFRYQDQRAEVAQNTRQFLQGLPANNILLYGDRGTGKSTTVKAIANEYAGRGLRLIELHKQDLPTLPRLLELLAGRGLKFLLFVDDLSFESGESGFRELKSVLEGGVEARPANVLLYATSNRRHLIKELFSERESDDEVRRRDTMEEKLSLADRFGITVTFSTPDQETYLAIVEGLAAARGLPLETHALREQALRWALWHNGRSPRSARQFVDQLEGELGMENQPAK